MINFTTIKLIVLICILLIISFIDIRDKIIPNELILITLFIGIIYSFIGNISIYNAFLGMIIGGGIMFVLAIIPNVLGGGDVKLMFALGAFLGPIRIIWAILLAFIIASVFSIILLIIKLIKKNEFIPFGPFLAIGTIIAYLFI
jgi:leader peptidase (prepilin peptidase) / N-methyltransferase